MEFRHEVIDSRPPAGRLASCLTTDLTGNGRPDVVMGALGRDVDLPFLPLQVAAHRLVRRFETNVFWYENPGWERHAISTAGDLHIGVAAALGDITGNGRVDLVVGQGYGEPDVYWYEQPAEPREPWRRRLLTNSFQKYHDAAIADVDDDGEIEVAGVSQEAGTVFYYDVPDDPYVEPWPEATRHVVDDDLEPDVEGIDIVDIDGDGRAEILVGTTVYHRESVGTDEWRKEEIAQDWRRTRIATADLDGDGALEVVVAEGDSPYLGYDGHPRTDFTGVEDARVAVFDPPEWEPTILRDDMFCPHSLQIADFDGDGLPDIYVAEMGLGLNDDPEHVVFENTGDGSFVEHVVERGVPTHEAQVADLDGDGQPDIVGQSYEQDVHVDAWYNKFGA